MTVIEELTDLVRTANDAASAAVVTIGSRGRGSGFVVAPGKVLTNAHNLRDRTTQVRFADGRAVQATVTGSDLDGDLVVLDVDTADITPAHLGGGGTDHRRRGRHGDSRTSSPSRDLGTGDRDGDGLRGSPGPSDHRCSRALRPVRARLVRGARARPRGPRRRHQHSPPRVRLLPGPVGGFRAARGRGRDGRRPHVRACPPRRGCGPGQRRSAAAGGRRTHRA